MNGACRLYTLIFLPPPLIPLQRELIQVRERVGLDVEVYLRSLPRLRGHILTWEEAANVTALEIRSSGKSLIQSAFNKPVFERAAAAGAAAAVAAAAVPAVAGADEALELRVARQLAVVEAPTHETQIPRAKE